MGASKPGSRVTVAFVVVGLALLASAAPALASHAKTDVVTTDDGSIYNGEIKSVQYATLSLDTNAAGTIPPCRRSRFSIPSKASRVRASIV